MTYQKMEKLIQEPLLHFDNIGPHVREGHYDLIGPDMEVILPHMWESVVEPGMAISMHLWPMPDLLSPPEDTMTPEPPISIQDERGPDAVSPEIEYTINSASPANSVFMNWIGKAAREGQVVNEDTIND
jgi:hypothetical protein